MTIGDDLSIETDSISALDPSAESVNPVTESTAVIEPPCHLAFSVHRRGCTRMQSELPLGLFRLVTKHLNTWSLASALTTRGRKSLTLTSNTVARCLRGDIIFYILASAQLCICGQMESLWFTACTCLFLFFFF